MHLKKLFSFLPWSFLKKGCVPLLEKSTPLLSLIPANATHKIKLVIRSFSHKDFTFKYFKNLPFLRVCLPLLATYGAAYWYSCEKLSHSAHKASAQKNDFQQTLSQTPLERASYLAKDLFNFQKPEFGLPRQASFKLTTQQSHISFQEALTPRAGWRELSGLSLSPKLKNTKLTPNDHKKSLPTKRIFPASRLPSSNPSPLQQSILTKTPSLSLVANKAKPGAGKVLKASSSPVAQHKETRIEGAIHHGFYLDALKAGADPASIKKITRALKNQINVRKDLRVGDRFIICFRVDDQGSILQVLWVQFKIKGVMTPVFWFTPSSQARPSAYIPPHRQAIPPQQSFFFLKNPVAHGRLSSGFGIRRHPTLGYTSWHKGIDFSAPMHTAVMAAADGKVLKVHYHGSYGKLILLQHAHGYSTLYAHLSAFSPLMRPGKLVRQGETIGYVGRTGRCTGPHLHYEVHINGRPIDPQRAVCSSGISSHGKIIRTASSPLTSRTIKKAHSKKGRFKKTSKRS